MLVFIFFACLFCSVEFRLDPNQTVDELEEINNYISELSETGGRVQVTAERVTVTYDEYIIILPRNVLSMSPNKMSYIINHCPNILAFILKYFHRIHYDYSSKNTNSTTALFCQAFYRRYMSQTSHPLFSLLKLSKKRIDMDVEGWIHSLESNIGSSALDIPNRVCLSTWLSQQTKTLGSNMDVFRRSWSSHLFVINIFNSGFPLEILGLDITEDIVNLIYTTVISFCFNMTFSNADFIQSSATFIESKINYCLTHAIDVGFARFFQFHSTTQDLLQNIPSDDLTNRFSMSFGLFSSSALYTKFINDPSLFKMATLPENRLEWLWIACIYKKMAPHDVSLPNLSDTTNRALEDSMKGFKKYPLLTPILKSLKRGTFSFTQINLNNDDPQTIISLWKLLNGRKFEIISALNELNILQIPFLLRDPAGSIFGLGLAWGVFAPVLFLINNNPHVAAYYNMVPPVPLQIIQSPVEIAVQPPVEEDTSLSTEELSKSHRLSPFSKIFVFFYFFTALMTSIGSFHDWMVIFSFGYNVLHPSIELIQKEPIHESLNELSYQSLAGHHIQQKAFIDQTMYHSEGSLASVSLLYFIFIL